MKDTAFLEIKTVDELAFYFGHTRQGLDYILYVLSEDQKYKEFHIKKRKGGTRVICSPNGSVRKLQIKLKASLQEIYQPKSPVHGYVQGRGIKSNAYTHTRKRWVGKIDLKDFFPSIHFGRLLGLFKSSPFNFSQDVAKRLAAICCYKGILPQGGVTSPIISNILCSKLDVELTKLSKQHKLSYSRYADDLAFSTRAEVFPSQIIEIQDEGIVAGREVEKIIIDNGFSINSLKTSLISSKSRQMVTGLVVNRKINVPKKFVRQLKGILHAWKKYGKASVEQRFFMNYDKRNRYNEYGGFLSFEDIIRGKVIYVGEIKGWKNSVYLDLAKKFEQLSERFEVNKIRSYNEKQLKVKLYSEGVTDLHHLEAAYSYYSSKGLFQHLKFDFSESLPLGGESKLFEKLDQQKGISQDTLTIFLFDRDLNQNKINEITNNGQDYSKWSKGLYATILPRPQNLYSDEKEVSIESFYTLKDARTLSEDNRRMFTKDEFDSSGVLVVDPTIKREYIGKAFFVDSGVKDQNGVSVSLSKKDFSLSIKNKTKNFENISFDGFKPIFELLSKIQNDHLTHMPKKNTI